MLVALALMLLVAAVAIITVDTANTDIELSYNQLHEEQAFYVAEAGAKRALSTMNADMMWRYGYAGRHFSEGAYTVNIVDSSGDPSLDDTVIIRATGVVDGSRATVELTVLPKYVFPFQYAMFADAGIALDRLTCTDSYDSDSGSYAATMLDSLGDVGSNGTVTSAKDVNFGGGIQVATPGGIKLGPANTVNGDTTSSADSVKLDVIPPEEYVWARNNSVATTGMSGSGFTYDDATKTLVAGSYSNIVLSSGVYYFSNITLGQESTLSLAPNAKVTIYVTDTVHLMQSSSMNAGGIPSSMMVYSSGPVLQFDQGNTFNGTFYGPKAHIQYDQTTQVFGSLVGNSIKLDQGACFHYDRSLGKIKRSANDGYEVLAWGEVY
jgi:hypothetical protein